MVAIVCSFPFTPDGKGARQHCPQYVLRWDLDLFLLIIFKAQANKLCFNTPTKLDLVTSVHHVGESLLVLHLFPVCPPSQARPKVGDRETKYELDCNYKNLFLALTQTVHRIVMSRKSQPSTDLRRNTNYTQEHGNKHRSSYRKYFGSQIHIKVQKKKCVCCLLLIISSMPQHNYSKHLTYKIQPFIYENSKTILCCCCHTQLFDHSTPYTE